MSTAVFSEIEDPRLQRRRNIRKRLAERDLLRADRREIENAKRVCDDELDQATCQHQATCQPLQTEISEIERKRAGLVASGQPVPESLDLRRRELLTEIREANAKLEAEAESHRQRVSALHREIREIKKREERYKDLVGSTALQHPDIANPRLLDELWVADNATKYAVARVRSAESKVKEYTDEIQRLSVPRSLPATSGTLNWKGETRKVVDTEQIRLYKDRLRRWRLELKAAQKWLADARNDEERIRIEIINE